LLPPRLARKGPAADRHPRPREARGAADDREESGEGVTIMASNYVMPPKVHNDLVDAAFRKRGFTAEESSAAARFCELAARHGIKTHNAIKALHLDEMFGSKAGGCVPGAKIDKLPSKYKALQRWNANKKLGQAVAFEAMQTCMNLADESGKETTDPAKVKALLPFGAHKGYGLSLIDELYAAYIGGSLPTIRNRWSDVNARPGEKGTCCFFFQCMKPDALACDDFAQNRSQQQNVKAILKD